MGGELKMPGGRGRGPRRTVFSRAASWACWWRMLCFRVDICCRMATECRRSFSPADLSLVMTAGMDGGETASPRGLMDCTYQCRLLVLQTARTVLSLLRTGETMGEVERAAR